LKSKELLSERLVYKPLSIAHCSADYVAWMNNPEVYKYLESGSNYSIDLLREFLIDIEKKNIYFWAIHLKSDGKHIGNIKIDPISTNNLTGEYGILIGDKVQWGKGYAAEASNTILKFCFQEIGLRKITLGVVAENLAAVALYDKIGFEKEGYYKSHSCCGGVYYDVVRMAIFNPNTVEN
jgi:RimJ/RimL family protein N-acetyltransferase